MTQRATTSLSIHYHVKPGQKEALLVEIKGILDRCAKEPEFIAAIVHETPERPNEFVFYELWKGTRADSRLDGIHASRSTSTWRVGTRTDRVRISEPLTPSFRVVSIRDVQDFSGRAIRFVSNRH